jgi:thioredoxin-like negative regulator of GroEL
MTDTIEAVVEPIVELTAKNFVEDFVNASGLVPALMEFYAPWCEPSLKMSKVVKQLGKKYEDKLRIFRVNVDRDGYVGSTFNVRGIPYLLLFQSREDSDYAKVRDRSSGYISFDMADRFVQQVLEKP